MKLFVWLNILALPNNVRFEKCGPEWKASLDISALTVQHLSSAMHKQSVKGESKCHFAPYSD